MRPLSRIIVVGSSNTDLVLACSRLPRPGETISGGEFQRYQGGKGANQAVAAARAGGRVIFIGCRGNDEFGRAASASLTKEGIDTRYFVAKKKFSSGLALIFLGGRSRENMICVAKSANDAMAPQDVLDAGKEFRGAKIVLSQLETPLPVALAAARLAQKYDIPFMLNPAPARPLSGTLLRLVHTLTPNEHEATVLTGEKDPRRAGQKLLEKGCRQVVITMGAKGALWVSSDGIQSFPAPKVKPIDTVGAGDCFSGWLAEGMANDLPMPPAIKRALAAASLSVTRKGAQSGMPYAREV